MVERLWRNTDYFRSKIEKLGFNIGVGQSPIIPIYIRDTGTLLSMGKEMLNQGIFTTSVTYPAVHQNEGRFRFILNASHTIEHIDKTLDVLEVLGEKYGVI